MGKQTCKWNHDEICTNDKSPCVADYCPVVEYPELCKFREVAEDINVPNKDEKTIEFDDDVVDLFVEFDEMGFAPTTTCPDPDECARDWRGRLVCAIKRVLEELECEKHNHGVTKEFYNNSVANSEKIFAEQKAEIERLTEEKKSDAMLLYASGLACEQVKAENAELQKQVDELKEERENMQAEIMRFEDMEFTQEHCNLYEENEWLKDMLRQYMNGEIVNENVFAQQVEEIKQVRKYTANEIYGEIDDSDILVVETQEYGEIEVVPMERLKEIIKSKGVEVE